MVLVDIYNGNLVMTEGKTFKDYFNEFIQEARMTLFIFAEYFGMNGEILVDKISNKSDSSDIHPKGTCP